MFIKRSLLGIVILLGGIVCANFAQGKTYRWVDKDGNISYSQTIPPSDAQFGHQELNEKNGMTIKKVESSRIRKQREKEKQLERERNKLNKKALQEELLVYMFSSKEELVRHFEERLKMISVNIRLLEYHQKKLKNSISSTGKKIKSVKNDKLKAKLMASLQESQRALIDHSRAITANQEERDEVSAQMVRTTKLYNRKFGRTQLNVGSLIGNTVLDKFRGKNTSSSGSSVPGASSSGEKAMCTCPCSASK